jgi:hypothetical protein
MKGWPVDDHSVSEAFLSCTSDASAKMCCNSALCRRFITDGSWQFWTCTMWSARCDDRASYVVAKGNANIIVQSYYLQSTDQACFTVTQIFCGVQEGMHACRLPCRRNVQFRKVVSQSPGCMHCKSGFYLRLFVSGSAEQPLYRVRSIILRNRARKYNRIR